MSEINLKLCPFCGSKAELGKLGTLGTDSEAKFFAECSNCGVTTILYYDAKDAAGAWNRRVD